MFTRIVGNIRDRFNKEDNKRDSPPKINLTLERTVSSPAGSLHSTTPLSAAEPAAEVDEDEILCKRRASESEVIGIQQRRRSTLFGYSQVSADDYMQKDLISSSWS